MENAQVVEGERVLSWRRCFAQFERSGLSQIKFCRQHGIALSSFTWWKRRLKFGTADRPAFIPVQLKEEAARTASISAWACEIVGPRVKLRLRERPDAAGMRDLIAMIVGEA